MPGLSVEALWSRNNPEAPQHGDGNKPFEHSFGHDGHREGCAVVKGQMR